MVSYLSLLTSALALAAPIAAQSAQIVPIINSLTTQTRNVQQAAQRINILSAPLLFIGQGPLSDVVRGVNEIAINAGIALAQLDSQQTVAAGADADATNIAWANFATQHTTLANILTAKSGLFNTAPFIGEPVAAALKKDRAAIEAYGLALGAKVPSHASDLAQQTNTVATAVQTAIGAYSGLSTSKRSLRFPRRQAVAAA